MPILSAIGCRAGDSVRPSDGRSGTARVAFHAITMGDSLPPDTYVRASAGSAVIDSIGLSSDGIGSVIVPVGDSVDVVVAPGSSSSLYASASWLRVFRDTAIDVVLLPTRWTVHAGVYADSIVPIDLRRATALGGDTVYLNGFAPSPSILTTWSPNAFPLRVGADTAFSHRRWTPSDSVFFWAAAERFNRVAGQRLFTPWQDRAQDRGMINLRIHAPFTDSVRAQTSLTIDPEVCIGSVRLCTDVSAVIDVPEAMLMTFPGTPFEEERVAGNTHTIEHELMHALGFGHGCYWPSIMMHTGPNCSEAVPMDPSAYDVAYIELVQELATVLMGHPRAWSLWEGRWVQTHPQLITSPP